jgi:hypothetical protein
MRFFVQRHIHPLLPALYADFFNRVKACVKYAQNVPI